MLKPVLVAVDTNFPLLLARQDPDAIDALDLVRARVRPEEIIVPPTALAELFFQAEFDSSEEVRADARTALGNLRSVWRFRAATFDEMDRRNVLAAANALLARGLLPRTERNDAKIIAESAALRTMLLVSNDSHLLEIDHRWVMLTFQRFGLPMPLIVSPRDIVRKFFR